MIKFIAKCFLFLCILMFVGGPVVFLLCVIEKSPKVSPPPELSFDNVKRVEKIVKNNKPNSMHRKEIRRVILSEEDLNLLAEYGVSQLNDNNLICTEIRLSDPLIHLGATVKVPKTVLGAYVNMEFTLSTKENKPDVNYIHVGKIEIPGSFVAFVAFAASFVCQNFLSPQDYKLIVEVMNDLHSVSIHEKQLILTYEWNPDSIAQIHESGKAFMISPEHQDKLIFYTNALTDLVVTVRKYHSRSISLFRVIQPLFKLAAGQSAVSNNPVLENRALLQALSLFCINQGIDKLVSKEKLKQVKPKTHIRFTLNGRHDLPKHFLISAGLTVSAGSKLSNFAGLSKEVDDSDKGSGFSFADLAADRAGVKLAELAIESATQASRLQQKMAAVKSESDFMPVIDNLPEGIMELEFKRQYKDLDSKAYAMINDEISRRIDECSAYK
ncbi:hypothetical protein [uncultured Desulfobacter sp.]|uniref:hypothetical protein n=1 Tax=uncultured Desulfobacter sp. TaxID=240139 RepID=UPI002AAB9874|nr:hypothetical protein [uncultured Desulfobacter sp.]